MKTNHRNVYIICSIAEDATVVFGTMKRAQEWILHFNKDVFKKSNMDDLYITRRVVF